MIIRPRIVQKTHVADQHTKPNEKGHKGHVSGTIGQEPVMLMIVQLIEEKRIDAKPDDLS